MADVHHQVVDKHQVAAVSLISLVIKVLEYCQATGTGTWDLGPGTWDLGPGTWDLGPRT